MASKSEIRFTYAVAKLTLNTVDRGTFGRMSSIASSSWTVLESCRGMTMHKVEPSMIVTFSSVFLCLAKPQLIEELQSAVTFGIYVNCHCH